MSGQTCPLFKEYFRVGFSGPRFPTVKQDGPWGKGSPELALCLPCAQADRGTWEEATYMPGTGIILVFGPGW